MPDFDQCWFLGPTPDLQVMKPGALNFNSCLRVSKRHPRVYHGSLLPDSEFSRLWSKSTYSGVTSLKWGVFPSGGSCDWTTWDWPYRSCTWTGILSVRKPGSCPGVSCSRTPFNLQYQLIPGAPCSGSPGPSLWWPVFPSLIRSHH